MNTKKLFCVEGTSTGIVKEFLFVFDPDGKIKDTVKKYFSEHPFLNINYFYDYNDLLRINKNNSTCRKDLYILLANKGSIDFVFDLVRDIRQASYDTGIILVVEDEEAVRDRRIISYMIDDIVPYPFKINSFIHRVILTMVRRNRCSVNRDCLNAYVKEKYYGKLDDIRNELCKISGGNYGGYGNYNRGNKDGKEGETS